MKIISSNTEAQIIGLLNDIKETGAGWHAAYLAFSNLQENYRNEYQMKIAFNIIKEVMSNKEGYIGICDNSSVYLLVSNTDQSTMDKVVFQLRYLFADDPLAYNDEGEENPEFCSLFTFDIGWEAFMKLCKDHLTDRIRVRKGIQPKKAEEKAHDRKKPEFNLQKFVEIERNLKRKDLSEAYRKQHICAVAGGQTRKVFDEIYTNIPQLKRILETEIDITRDKWLFKYFTQILDTRILKLLQENQSKYLGAPISINLNLLTLFSEAFENFDKAIPKESKISIVIEIQIADVLDDMAAFLTIKETVQKLGYRICLDGVTDLSFIQIDRKRLGFDLIKLLWNSDVKSNTDEKTKALAEAVKQCGGSRVILCRCDNKDAVEYGQSLGIQLFQGRYLDSLTEPHSEVEN